MATEIPIPEGLTERGERMWVDFTAKYDFRLDELAILERACRLAGRIDDMERDLGHEMTSLGSMGQVVVHPLIPEIRAHTAAVASLLKSLKLPDDGVSEGESRSVQARAAAASRWTVSHGAGA